MNLLSHLGVLLAIAGGTVDAVPQRPGQTLAQDSHFRKFEAMQRADHEVCRRWIPKIRQAERLRTANNATSYARLTRGVQPAWVARNASRYRTFLNDWMYATSRSSPPERLKTRRQTDSFVALHLRLGTIRIWQANVKFRAVDGRFSLTRIGVLPIDPNKPRQRVTPADFDRAGFRYVISRSDVPTPNQIDPDINHDRLFVFIDNGYTYFINPNSAMIVSSKDSILSLLPRTANPSGDRGSVVLARTCD